MSQPNAFENRSLKLLGDIQRELAAALNSLGEKKNRGLEDHFPFYCASHINRAVEGFILLRQQFRLDASRLLIRPAIEAAIKILAVRNQPDLLYRIAYSERLEDKKFINAAASKKAIDLRAQEEARWNEFVKAYSDHFPEHKLVDQKLSLRCAAAVAGIEPYYDSAYRLYCQFTHAAFRAITGNLDELYIHDSRTMALCGLTGLDAVALLSGLATDLETLRRRLSELNISAED